MYVLSTGYTATVAGLHILKTVYCHYSWQRTDSREI